MKQRIDSMVSFFRRWPTWRVVSLYLIQAAIIAMAIGYAFILGFDFDVPENVMPGALIATCWYLPMKLFLLGRYGQVCGVISFYRLPDLARVIKACSWSFALMLLAFYWEGTAFAFPRRVILGEFFISLSFISAYRLSLRVVRQRYLLTVSDSSEMRRVGIFGAGDTGETLASELNTRPALRLKPVVFFDDAPHMRGIRIQGMPVVALEEDFSILKQAYRIDEIIVAIPSLPRKRYRDIVEKAAHAGLKVETLPSYSQLAAGKVTASKLRPVDIEDVMTRETVELDSASIDEMLAGNVVMVTGGGGSIGSELCRQIVSRNPELLIIVDHSEYNLYKIDRELEAAELHGRYRTFLADICDGPRIKALISKHKPSVIFHAAAYKHVTIMESNAAEALNNNAIATAHLAEWASEAGVGRFILLSTDKAINPTSVMGASKRMAERAIQAIQHRDANRTRFMAVRFGNVLGSSGSVIPLFKKQISEGGPITITDKEVERYFMTIPEAVGLVLQCGAFGKGGDIFVLDMGESMKIVDVAKRLIELSGYTPHKDIEIEYIGLRPGEKLFEELSHEGEQFANTDHEQIFRFLASSPMSNERFSQCLEEMEELSDCVNSDRIKLLFKRFIPEYTPQLEAPFLKDVALKPALIEAVASRRTASRDRSRSASSRVARAEAEALRAMRIANAQYELN